MAHPIVKVIVKDKANDLDNYYIFLAYSFGERNPTFWSLNICIPRELWDKHKRRIATNSKIDIDKYKLDNKYIDREIELLEIFIRKRRVEGLPIDKYTIKQIYRPTYGKDKHDVQALIKQFLKDNNNLSKGRLNGYRAIFKYMLEYSKPNQVININNSYAEGLYNYLVNLNISDNTIKDNYFAKIRVFLNYCKSKGLDIPPKTFKAPTKAKINYQNHYCLFKEERKAFYDLNIKPNSHLYKYWLGYMFVSMTGLLQADLNKLTKNNLSYIEINGVKHYYIHHRRSKVDTSNYYIPLCDYAMFIIKQLGTKHKLIDIPVGQVSNRYLKILLKQANINSNVKYTKVVGGILKESLHPKYDKITMLTSRKTFENILFENGVSDLDIDYFLGHSLKGRMHAHYRVFTPERVCLIKEKLSFV